jgi:mutator protein MutT
VIAGRDYIGVGVGAIVFNAEGHVFLARRGAGAKNEKGYWEFPGGEVEFGESLVDAVHRELREEYGIAVRVLETLGTFDHILKEEHEHWVSTTFITRLYSGIPKIIEPFKCTGIGWYPLTSLPEPLSVISRDNYKRYFEKYDLEYKW